MRHWRNSIARHATGQLDHAWESKPGHERVAHDGVRTSHRQRCDHHLGRCERELRTERDDADNGARPFGIHPIAGQRSRYFL